MVVPIIAALSLLATLLVAVSPASASTKWHLDHPAQARHDLLGYRWTYGTNVKVYIAGWTTFMVRKRGPESYANIKLVKPCVPPHCIPTKPMAATGHTVQSDVTANGGTYSYDAVHRTQTVRYQYSPRWVCRHFGHGPGCKHKASTAKDPWWEPWTWPWSTILHTIYDWLVSPCWHGAIGGAKLKFGTDIVSKVVTQGAALGRLLSKFSGPEGWAAMVMLGCLSAIKFPGGV
jgi:hypothetical protein